MFSCPPPSETCDKKKYFSGIKKYTDNIKGLKTKRLKSVINLEKMLQVYHEKEMYKIRIVVCIKYKHNNSCYFWVPHIFTHKYTACYTVQTTVLCFILWEVSDIQK